MTTTPPSSFRTQRVMAIGSTQQEPQSATPSPPPPRLTSAHQAPSSQHHHQQLQSHAHSPNTNRAKREAFPRSQLWTWKHEEMTEGADFMNGRSGGDKDDLIESMLRECAPTVPLIGSGGSNPGTPGSHDRRIGGTLMQHQSSTLSSSSSIQSQQQQQQQNQQNHHPFLASKRRIQTKNSQQPLRSVPSSSRNLGSAGDGWRTYKLAHRTNKLIAKTRKAVEMLAKEQDGNGGSNGGGNSQKKKSGDGADGEDENGADVNETTLEDTEKSGAEKVHFEQLAALEKFTREVLDDDDDEGDGLLFADDQARSRLQQESASKEAGDDGKKKLDGEEFWNIYKTSTTCKRPDSARGRYIAHCEKDSLLVLPVLDLEKPTRYDRTKKSLCFDNYYFGDQRAEAFGDALQILPVQVKHLSMKNVGISGGGSSAILNGILLRNLSELNFSENRIGTKGMLKIFKSLQDPHVHLKTLDLGNNQLGDQAVKLLIQCLLNRCTVQHLDLRRNQIFHAAKAVGELLRITTPLKSLNLSWDNIRGEPAQYLAKCMMENITLTHLDLSDNTFGNNGNADAELGACLATNKSLKHLDVSNNHIHGKSVLIYVNGLQQNSVLETLVVRGNPIGSLGAEAILRSVSSGSITKCQLDIGECNLEIQESSQQNLIYGGGTYTLNLVERSDVILLREMLLLCWKNKTEIIEASYNGAPYSFNRKDEKSFLSSTPPSGTMQLKIQPNYDRHEEMIPPNGFDQMVKLMQRSFGQMKEDEEESKLFCIRLLSEEYSFNVDQVNTLLSLFQTHTSQVEKATAAAALIPQIHQTVNTTAVAGAAATATTTTTKQEIYDCASMETPEEFFEDKDKDGKIDVCGDICMVIGLKSLSDIEQGYVEQKVGKWISFNVNNPTGKYRLNMTNSIDRRILMRILEINKYEKKLRQQWKLLDVSQHGEKAQPLQGNFRNVKLNHLPVVMDTSWQFPRLGILEFDFVMTKRPYAICTALNDAAFEKFLKEFKQLDVSAELKLIGLRSISTLYYFTCSQAQRVMEHFGTFERDPKTGSLFRAEVFIILFSRIVDEWNFGESLALLDLITKTQMLDRVGYLNYFHPMQNNETYEHLLLDIFDQRQLVLITIKLATGGEAELTNVVLNNDIAVEMNEWKTWTTDDKLPAQGSLSFSMRVTQAFQSKAQLPLASYRKKLMQSLLLKPETKAHEMVV